MKAFTIRIIGIVACMAVVASSYASIPSNDPTKAFRAVAQPDYPFKNRIVLGTPDNTIWDAVKKPYPTSAWFGNFALRGGSAENPNKTIGEQPLFPTPYTIKNVGDGLAFGVPAASFANYEGETHAQVYGFSSQMRLTAKEADTFERRITHVSDLSATLSYIDGNRSLSFPIVRGAPYITALYKHLTPVITPGSGVNGVIVGGTANMQPPNTPIHGSCFQVVLSVDASNTQTWVIFSEKPITLSWKAPEGEHGWQLLTPTPYDGWLRVALLKDTKMGINNDLALLSQYADTIPLSGEVHTSHDTITFKWKTENGQAPLMMALPHQRALFKSEPVTDKVAFRVTQGQMQAVAGKSTWVMDIAVPKTSFLELSDHQISALPADRRQAIITTLKTDGVTVNDTAIADGPYGAGKRFARAARLALIADQFSKIDKSLIATKNHILTELTKNLTSWVKGDNKFNICAKVENNTCVETKVVNNSLVYDTTWGGIIPTVDDYGSQIYNDHHFHYGYFVYTYAVLTELAKQDKAVAAWLKTPVTTLAGGSITPAEWIKVLIRDYANPNKNDNYFPYARHIDFFNGHSYASGLDAAADGRNQESVSEAVNAYYGLALLGEAQGDRELAQWGKLLLAKELRAGQTYWQIAKGSDIYSSPFTDGRYITGILFDGKTDSHLFFSCQEKKPFARECAYGIEMMPFTAISSQLLKQPWAAESYGNVTKYYNETVTSNPAWNLLLLKGRVMGAPAGAVDDSWKAALNSDSGQYDNGDSKANTLYVIAAQSLAR
jgi:endo-1,3(4)-beta-glucanase